MKLSVACLPAVLLAMLGPTQALCAAEVLVSGPEALMQALSHAEGGEVIRLAPGAYGKITLGPASAFPVSFPAPGIILRSADPAHPAVFGGLVLKAVDNLSFEDITFDYRFGLGDLPFTMPFNVTGGDHIAFRNSRFLGDNAHGIGSAENGFGYATGLSLRNVDGAELDGNLFTTFRNGIQIQSSKNIVFQNNDVTDMRSDGLDLAGVAGVVIRGNHFHDFRGMPNWIDHRDMIQLWSTGMSMPSQDITIAGNLFDIGQGSFTQTIFLRNELVDQKQAGAEMYYRNIRIVGNTIYNNHRHAITVGETNRLQIAHNSVLEVPDRSATAPARGDDPASYRPTINVAPDSHNVAITQNASLAITGYSEQPDWRLSGNVIVQDRAPNLPGYYGHVFVSSTLRPEAANHSYIARLDGPLGRGLAGAPATLQPAPTGRYEARFSVLPSEKEPLARIFDAEASTTPDGQHLAPSTRVEWHFGDGKIGTARRVLHRYDRPGIYHVTLRLTPQDGAAATTDMILTLTDADLL
ncbi:PKD domain-containing protein, partial [Thioclava sp. BHET1]